MMIPGRYVCVAERVAQHKDRHGGADCWLQGGVQGHGACGQVAVGPADEEVGERGDREDPVCERTERGRKQVREVCGSKSWRAATTAAIAASPAHCDNPFTTAAVISHDTLHEDTVSSET
eukprot:604070-Prymnesium_polylepis.2